jgi:hypothetical protein
LEADVILTPEDEADREFIVAATIALLEAPGLNPASLDDQDAHIQEIASLGAQDAT